MMTFRLAAVGFLVFVVAPSIAEEAEGHYPLHEIAIAAGGAWNDSESANFAGIEYEYRASAKWGFGGLYETTWRGFDLEIVAAHATYFPTSDWKFFAGAGIERELRKQKDKALARFGVGYLLPAGEVTLMPLLYVDWVEDNSTVTYLGLAVGFHL